MSRGTKIAVGIVSGLVVLCCILGVTVFLISRMALDRAIVSDPTQAAQLAAEIAEYDLPPGYSEQGAMNLGFTKMVMIVPDTQTKPVIMLMQFAAGAADPDTLRRQMEQSFQQQNGRQGFEMEVVEEKEVTIKGEPVILTVREGSDSQGNTMRQVTGVFEGKNGLVMLMMMGETDKWDDEEIDGFIESIR